MDRRLYVSYYWTGDLMSVTDWTRDLMWVSDWTGDHVDGWVHGEPARGQLDASLMSTWCHWYQLDVSLMSIWCHWYQLDVNLMSAWFGIMRSCVCDVSDIQGTYHVNVNPPNRAPRWSEIVSAHWTGTKNPPACTSGPLTWTWTSNLNVDL